MFEQKNRKPFEKFRILGMHSAVHCVQVSVPNMCWHFILFISVSSTFYYSLWIVQSVMDEHWTNEHLLLNEGLLSNTQTKSQTMRYQKKMKSIQFIWIPYFVIRHPVYSVFSFVVGFRWFKYNFDLQSERNTFGSFPNVENERSQVSKHPKSVFPRIK